MFFTNRTTVNNNTMNKGILVINTFHKSDSILEETISKIGVTIIAKAVKMIPQLSLGIVFVSTSLFFDNKLHLSF